MEVMHHQPNGTRKGHRQVRPPSQGSTNESASDVEQQLNTRGEGSHIALPFANSTTSHYVPDSDDSDTESRPMLINTEGKEEAEVDKLEDEDMDAEKANYDASEEAPADQDAASESENHTSSSALSGGNIEKFAGERQPETSELPMDTTVSADKEDIHKDPMSPEIQVVSSGQVGPWSCIVCIPARLRDHVNKCVWLKTLGLCVHSCSSTSLVMYYCCHISCALRPSSRPSAL